MIENNDKLFLHRHVLVLKYFGLWTPKTPNILYTIYGISTLSIQYIGMLCILIDLWIIWGDIDAVSQNSYLMLSEASNLFKMTTVVYNTNGFRKILDSMNVDTFAPRSSAQEKILLEQSRKVRNMHNILLIFAIVSSLLWGLAPLFTKGPRTFPLILWMPFNPETSLGFALGYTYEMIFCLSATPILVTMIAFGITTILFGCAQLDIVKDKLQKIPSVPSVSVIPDGTEREQLVMNNNKQLKEIIDHHQAIVRFIENVEELLNVITFFHLSVTVLIICTNGLRLITASPNTITFYRSFMFLCCILAQLYFYCWSGSQLTTRCEELRDELYQCPWTEQDRSFRKTLLIAMECMKRPIVFRAGHYITLSGPTFVAILRCSYSYFAVLNQVRNE